jgi:hypothetical protein
MRRLWPSVVILCLASWTAKAAVSAESNAAPVLLEVDASEAPQKIYHARLAIPVQPGPVTLYYPK